MFNDLEFVTRMNDELKAMGYTHIRISLGMGEDEPYLGYYAYEVIAHHDNHPYGNAGHIIVGAPFAEVERMILDAFRRTMNLLKGVEEDKVVM